MTQEALKLALEALEGMAQDLGKFPAEIPAITAIKEALEQPEQQDYWQEEARRYAQNAEFWRGKYEAAIAQQPDHIGDVNKMVLVEDLAAELFAVAQQSPADDGFSDTINRIEAWLRKHFTIPLQPEQEPVAWRFKPMIGSPWSLSDDGYYISCKRDQRYIVEPLYTAPQPKQPEPVQEPLAWMVYTLDGKSVCVTDNPNDFSEEHRALALYTIPPRPEQDDEPATCWKCGEDGGTSCGIEACGLIEAQPEQEPVAWIYAPTVGDGPKERRLTFVPPHEWGTQLCIDIVPLYTSPPQRKPLPLKEVERLIYKNTKINPNVADDRELLGYIVNAARSIEAAHGIKEKNNG